MELLDARREVLDVLAHLGQQFLLELLLLLLVDHGIHAKLAADLAAHVQRGLILLNGLNELLQVPFRPIHVVDLDEHDVEA